MRKLQSLWKRVKKGSREGMEQASRDPFAVFKQYPLLLIFPISTHHKSSEAFSLSPQLPVYLPD